MTGGIFTGLCGARIENEWREIPGFGGWYEASFYGQIRSWKDARWTDRRAKKPHLMSQYLRKSGNCGRKRFCKIRYEGMNYEIAAAKLVALAWLGEIPEGCVISHRNGDLTDNSVRNLEFINRSELGRRSGAKAKRQAVALVGPDGKVKKFYSSAREAGRMTNWSYQAIMDRCNGKIRKEETADGCVFRWAEEIY